MSVTIIGAGGRITGGVLSLICPGTQSVNSPDGNPVVVTFPTPIPVGGTAPYGLVSCTPGSGSSFPVGSTTVHCSVTDASSVTTTCSFVVAVAAAIAAYYVSWDGGFDGNPGTITQPFRSINHACSFLTPGDTLICRGGRYLEGLENVVPSGTDDAHRVKIHAFPGETVTLAPGTTAAFAVLFTFHQQYIEFDGINIESSQGIPNFGGTFKIGCFADTVSNPHHIRYKNADVLIGSNGVPNEGTHSAHLGFLVSANYGGTIGGNEFYGNTVHGGGDPGDFAAAFYIENSNNIVGWNDVYDISGWAVQSWNDYDFPPDNNVFIGNLVHDITRSADGRYEGIVTGSGSTNTWIINNRVWNIGGPGPTTSVGIYMYSGTAHCINNTVYHGNGEGIVVEIFQTGTEVRNNISFANSVNNYRDSGPNHDTVADHNEFINDPLFVNVPGANFQLTAASPCFNTGATIPVADPDAVGVSRPQGPAYDKGALERPVP